MKIINIIMGSSLVFKYPSGSLATEQPLWITFYAANYSLNKNLRTPSGVIGNRFAALTLPMPKEPGYQVRHEFGEGTNPVGPVLSVSALQNSGGNFDTLWNRIIDPAKFQNEYMYATTTYRRFSNITEATMVSEARKEYYFEYIFVPKNSSEAENAMNIIGTFRKSSYPVRANLPERTYPQSLWAFRVTAGTQVGWDLSGQNDTPEELTGNWLGDPLTCVLANVMVKFNDASDPVIRYLPNGLSNVMVLGLLFREFETGTYDPSTNRVMSKSEIAARYL